MRAGRGPVKPGDSDAVSVFVDTTGRSGKLVKTVRVSTNDLANSSFTLVIRAEVEPPSGPLQAEPR